MNIKQNISRPFNLILKLYSLISFLCKKILFQMVFSIFTLTLSQLFLLMAYLLPIKILILLSVNTIPDFLNTIFNNFTREQVILILSFSVFFMYGIHLFLEKITATIVDKSWKVLLNENIILEKDIFLKKFIENFFKLTSTFVLVFLLFCILFYLLPIIAIGLMLYLLMILTIFFSIKLEKRVEIKFFHVSFSFGFIVMFIYEVIYLLYYNKEEVSIIVILISIVVIRYVFLRGIYIVNKLLVLYRDLDMFYKKV